MKLLKNMSMPELPYVVCDVDGRVIRAGSAPAHLIDIQALAGQNVFLGVVDQATEYIADPTGDGEATSRPAHGITIDFLAIYGPTPGLFPSAFVWGAVAGASNIVTDSACNVFTATGDGDEINLRLDRAGVHYVRVESFPNLDFVDSFPSEF